MSSSGKGKILITGVPGQVGQCLYNRIGSDGAFQLTRDHCDLSNLEHVLSHISRGRPSMVVHAAGVAIWKSGEPLTPAEAERMRLGNAVATDNIAKACAMSGTPLIAISCDSVLSLSWPFERPIAYDETVCVSPYGMYASTKASAEHAILRLAQFPAPQVWKSGYRYWVIRTSALYEEPWRFKNNLPSLWRIGTAKKNAKVRVPTDVFFSPTYVPHFVDSLITFMENLHLIPSGIYHMRSEGHCSAYEFARKLRMHVKNSPQIEPTSAQNMGEWLHNSVYYPRAILSMKKLFKYLGDSIKIPTWEVGVEAYSSSVKKRGSPATVRG